MATLTKVQQLKERFLTHFKRQQAPHDHAQPREEKKKSIFKDLFKSRESKTESLLENMKAMSRRIEHEQWRQNFLRNYNGKLRKENITLRQKSGDVLNTSEEQEQEQEHSPIQEEEADASLLEMTGRLEFQQEKPEALEEQNELLKEIQEMQSIAEHTVIQEEPNGNLTGLTGKFRAGQAVTKALKQQNDDLQRKLLELEIRAEELRITNRKRFKHYDVWGKDDTEDRERHILALSYLYSGDDRQHNNTTSLREYAKKLPSI